MTNQKNIHVLQGPSPRYGMTIEAFAVIVTTVALELNKSIYKKRYKNDPAMKNCNGSCCIIFDSPFPGGQYVIALGPEGKKPANMTYRLIQADEEMSWAKSYDGKMPREGTHTSSCMQTRDGIYVACSGFLDEVCDAIEIAMILHYADHLPTPGNLKYFQKSHPTACEYVIYMFKEVAMY